MPDATKDIRLTWDTEAGEADVSFSNNDIDTDDGLETAVIISLFSDRRASVEDVLPDVDSRDRRGWWGDKTTEDEEDQIGSRLWLLARLKTVPEVLTATVEYAQEALQWLVDEGIAAEVTATAERLNPVSEQNILAIKIEILRVSGNTVAFEFQQAWEAMFNGS